jgi:methyl coenzyme M reductase subunit C
LLLASFFLSIQAYAQTSIVLVVNENSKVLRLTRDELAVIYMGNVSTNTTLQALQVLDMQEGDVRDKFYLALMGKTRNQMHAYWARQVFTNRAIPPKEYSEMYLIEMLLKYTTVIAYLPSDKVKPGMRIVLQLN